MKPREKNANYLYLALPVLGIVFLLWYVVKAGADVVYSDYIRLIDSYLPDVKDLSVMLTPDILTRSPATYIQRIINVESFSYSVLYDRICTLAGIALMAGTLCRFALRRRIHPLYYLAVMVVLFSLIKWEVLMNGTCWIHMVSIGLFFVNYAVFDEIWQGEASGMTELIACILPLLWLLFAGEYIASYCATMILLSGYGVLTGGGVKVVGRKVQQVFIRILVMTVLALALYMLSRSYTVWEHAGTTEMTLPELIEFAPSFLPKFFVKSFAGAVLGQETIMNFAGGKPLPDFLILLLGFLMVLAYLVAFYLYFVSELTEKTVFPLCLLISGFLNHGLVTVGRWIFLNENYGLSSRYAGQFMIGLIGLILTAAVYKKPKFNYRGRSHAKLRRILQGYLIAMICVAVAGNIYTSWQEVRKMPYRRANYEHMAEVVLDYTSYSDEEICRTLEWNKDPQTALHALGILKDNRLNVFSR